MPWVQGLYSLGVPKTSVAKYETSIKAGKFVLVAHGTAQEVAKARDMLKTSGAAEVAIWPSFVICWQLFLRNNIFSVTYRDLSWSAHEF